MARPPSIVRTVSGRIDRCMRRASRYDVVLAVIPLAFVTALVVSSTVAVPPAIAIGIASAVGLIAVVDALFLNPPRGPTVRPPMS